MAASPQEVTQMLVDWRNGDKQALDRLMPLVYGELRERAGTNNSALILMLIS